MNDEIFMKIENEIMLLNKAYKALESAERALKEAEAVRHAPGFDASADAEAVEKMKAGAKAEIKKKENVSMCLSTLSDLGIEIGELIPFADRADAVFVANPVTYSIALQIRTKAGKASLDVIAEKVVGIVTYADRKKRVDFSKANACEEYSSDELKALVNFLTGVRGYTSLKSVAAKHVDEALATLIL